MNSGSSVEIILDLREFSSRVIKPEDFRKLWTQLTPALIGRTLSPGDAPILKDPRRGTVRLQVISVPTGFSKVDQNAAFSIYSVLEQPVVTHRCSVCSGYAPFVCSTCTGEKKRMCNEHAVILDGSMRAFCPGHAPLCASSGSRATFWCDGPDCRGRVGWSEASRTAHPNDADHWYCPACFKQLFPRCEDKRCNDTGTVSCEHVDSTRRERCGRRVCNRHAWRWQIYGPHRVGLGLCPHHRDLRQLSDEAIVFQLIAGTAFRNRSNAQGGRNRRREFFNVPSLQSIRHIFLHTRKDVYDVRKINVAVENLAGSLGSEGLHGAMKNLIERSAVKRREDIKRDVSEKELGVQEFQRLRNELVAFGLSEIADAIEFSDFRPRANLLFIHLDDQWKGRFIGRGGSNIKAIQEKLGFRIKFEKSGGTP